MDDQVQPDIEQLDLAATARAAAYALRRAHPQVVFTSGRRDRAAQAHAMASNVVENRKWIGATYLPTPASQACQQWVDEHPEAETVEAIAFGLLDALNQLPDDQVGHLSRHLSGHAFDVQPVTDGAAEIKSTIRGLPGLEKFLELEGGLVRWHAQFYGLVPRE